MTAGRWEAWAMEGRQRTGIVQKVAQGKLDDFLFLRRYIVGTVSQRTRKGIDIMMGVYSRRGNRGAWCGMRRSGSCSPMIADFLATRCDSIEARRKDAGGRS